MQEKIFIRREALINRKKNYFEVTSSFFNPLISLLKKKKKNSTNILSLYYPSNSEVNVLCFFENQMLRLKANPLQKTTFFIPYGPP